MRESRIHHQLYGGFDWWTRDQRLFETSPATMLIYSAPLTFAWQGTAGSVHGRGCVEPKVDTNNIHGFS